jgi:ribonuclease J
MRYAHAKLGQDLGINDQRLIENGDALEFTPNETKKIGRVSTGRVMVDGKNMGDLEDVEIRDREKMAESGIVVAYAVVDKNNGELAQRLELFQRGFLGDDEEDRISSAVQSAEAAVDKMSPSARKNENELREELQDAVQSYFSREINRTPVVIPIVHEM